MDKNRSIKKSIITVGFEKTSMILFQFISSIILARLLEPSDYGTVAMLAIFISLSTTIVDSGFGGALVYFKDVTKKDYSTVFWINLLLSVSLYILMFVFADPISIFYNTPILSDLIKILGLTIVFNSLGVVQFTILYKNLEFKKIAYVSIITYILSAVIAIIMAYYGYGVWSLICQQVLSSVLKTCFLFGLNRFIPAPYFSYKLLKKHWNYGNGLFFSTILLTVYDNMYVQLIGKYCTIVEAGLYNQAKKLKDIPTNLFSQTFSYSLFPIFSKIEKDDIFYIKYKKVNNVFAFVCVPIFLIIGLLSKPIVIFLLGEKWLGSSYILQWLSYGSIFYIIEMVNRSALKAKGLTNIIFKCDLIKRLFGILLILILVIYYNIVGVIIAYCINSFIGWCVNSYILSKRITYSFFRQMLDILRYVLYSIPPFIVAIIFNEKVSSNIYESLLGVTIIFSIIYLCLTAIFHDKSFCFILSTIKNYFRKR